MIPTLSFFRRAGVPLAIACALSVSFACKKKGGGGGSSDGGSSPDVTIQTATCDDPSKVVTTQCAVSQTTALPVGLASAATVMLNGYAYVIGGTQLESETRSRAEVYVAKVGDNESVGNWTATASLPTAVSRTTAAASNGFIYVLGGIVAGSTNVSQAKVQIGAVAADGSITGWTAGPDLPEARASGAAVVVGSKLYFLGGYADFNHGDAAAESEGKVYMSEIAGDGTLGAWTKTTSLPSGRAFFSALTFGGRIYVVGGTYKEAASRCQASKVLVSELNADGSPKGWAKASSWGDDMRSGAATIANGTLVVGGGVIVSSGNASTANVLGAPINSDGSLGAFKIIAHLPQGTVALMALSTPTQALMIGGNPSTSNDLLRDVVAIKVAGGEALCAP